jgi:hypothetical protein
MIEVRLPYTLGPLARALWSLILIEKGFLPVMEPDPNWER